MGTFLLFAAFSSVWGALPAAARHLQAKFGILIAWHLLGAVLLGVGLAGLRPNSYRLDSFWTLEPFDRAIVGGMTAGLMLIGGCVVFQAARALVPANGSCLARGAVLSGNLGLTLAAYFVTWLLTPQIYYLYYRLIFANLPQQWVVHSGADAAIFGRSLLLLPESSIAATATGLYFWLIVALTVSIHAMSWRAAPRTNR